MTTDWKITREFRQSPVSFIAAVGMLGCAIFEKDPTRLLLFIVVAKLFINDCKPTPSNG